MLLMVVQWTVRGFFWVLGLFLIFYHGFVVLNATARIGKREGRLSPAHGVGQSPGSLKNPEWYDVS